MIGRRGFLKGVLAMGGLAVVAPHCLLSERPGLWTVAKLELATAQDLSGLEGSGFALNQILAEARALRQPVPYDVSIDGKGFMLGRQTWPAEYHVVTDPEELLYAHLLLAH